MAIYHCSLKPISRGAGQSIVAAAAYRHTCKLENSRTGEVFDYSRKQGLESSCLYFPSGVNPTWAQDREKLWNAAESAEKRKDARLGRELVLALPAELSPEQRCELTGEMARYLVDRYGLAVDVAIHQPSHHGDERNHHAHILMSSRRITQDGFGAKARELDDKTSGPQEVESIRAAWAGMANRALEKAKQYTRIDHRSLKAQGIHRQPTIHLGVAASAMERRGITTRLGERNRACIVAGKIAVRQWHEKWIKRQEEIRQTKAAEEAQTIAVPHKETREELEGRLYGKTEKKKDINEIYVEAIDLYKKDLENKRKTEEKNQSTKTTDIDLLKEYNELGKVLYTDEEFMFMSAYRFGRYIYIEEPSEKELLLAKERLRIAKESLQKFEEDKKRMGFFSKLWNQTDLVNEKDRLSCEVQNAEYECSKEQAFFERAIKEFKNSNIALKIKELREREASERQAVAMKRPEMKAAIEGKEQEEARKRQREQQQGQYRGR